MSNLQSRLDRFSQAQHSSMLGAFLRIPLRLLPPGAVLPILTGPLKGTRWVAGSFIARCWLGTYEREKQQEILKHLRQGQVAYDIGAHAGFFTLLFTRLVGQNGRVIAFEPVPANVEKILRHLRLNKTKNASVIPIAVSSGSGFSGFQEGKFDSGGQLVESDTPLIAPRVSIDEVIEMGLPAPNLVKIDVEGAELDVLRGGRLLLESHSAVWFVALHGHEMLQECPRLFDQRGYRVTWLGEGGSDTLGRRLAEIVAVPEEGGRQA